MRLEIDLEGIQRQLYATPTPLYVATFTEFIATLPPFGPKEGHKWFFQISSQWESQKTRFAFISFGKI